MPEGLLAAFSADGLWPLALVTFGAGMIYGFAGFGSALIFMPVAAVFVPAEWAVLLMALYGLSSAVTVLPRAWSAADRTPTLQMVAAAIVLLPAGTWILSVVPQDPLRWAISATVAVTLAALLTGWRYAVAPGLATRAVVGAASGALGGATGLTGPIVILFHLGGPASAEATRANTIVFLTLLGVALLPSLALRGLISADPLWLALLLVPLYMAGTRAGQALFRPGQETTYRRIAYGVIALAVLVGLPVWS